MPRRMIFQRFVGDPRKPKHHYPEVALFCVDGQWKVVDDNPPSTQPDGFVVTRDAGASFVIDDAATEGLTLSVVDGRPQVSYP